MGNLLPPTGLGRLSCPSQDGTSCGTAGAGVTRKKLVFCPPQAAAALRAGLWEAQASPGVAPTGLSGPALTVKTSGCSVSCPLGRGHRPAGVSAVASPVLSVSPHGTDRRDGPFSVTERKKGTTRSHPWKTAGDAGLARLQSGSVGLLKGQGWAAAPLPPRRPEQPPLCPIPPSEPPA